MVFQPLLLLTIGLPLVCSLDLPPELQALIQRQNDRMANFNSLKASVQPDSQGLISRLEYGELLKAALNLDDSRSSADTRKMIDDYVKTLPERVDPEGVMMDIGSGGFAQVMMKKFEDSLYEDHSSGL